MFDRGMCKKLVVLKLSQSDRLDFPAGVIRSLFQADPFPCSVASLGRPDLFKALDSQAYAQEPMATRNLIRAPGKREISASPLLLIRPIQPRCRFTGYTQAVNNAPGTLYTRPLIALSIMGPIIGVRQQRRDQGWELPMGLFLGLMKQCCLSCSARCTINFPMHDPFILPILSGCAFKNYGCLIFTPTADLFYLSSCPKASESEVTLKFSKFLREASSSFFLLAERFFYRLTTLMPCLCSFNAELLPVWVALLSRFSLCTREKILVSLRFGVFVICCDTPPFSYKPHSGLLLCSTREAVPQNGKYRWKIVAFVLSRDPEFLGRRRILEGEMGELSVSSGVEGSLSIRIYISASKMLILLLNYYYMPANNTTTRLHIATNIKETAWQRFRQAYKKKFKKEHQASTFVVVAALALVRPQSGNFLVAAVAQGTKSLPFCVMTEQNREDLLVDMHAEMLVLRAFKRFLLEQIKKRQKSEYLVWNAKKQKYSLKQEYEIWLYCSQVFCGNCCISQQEGSFSGAKPLAFLKETVYPNEKYKQDVLRTKPGRSDLPVNKRSAVLSCSDLIGLSNILGIQGKTLFSSITPIYLSAIILDGAYNLKESITKGVNLPLRLSNLKNKSIDLIQRQLYNIVIQSRQRKISSQFKHASPELILFEKEESRDREGFELCGIFSQGHEEWINGRTGLPQGSSLKNYRQKGKISRYSQTTLAKQFELYRNNQFSFKYDAIIDRIKKLFGEWINGTAQ